MCINTFQVIAGVLAILSAPKSPVSVLLQLWMELLSRTPPYGQYTCTHTYTLCLTILIGALFGLLYERYDMG